MESSKGKVLSLSPLILEALEQVFVKSAGSAKDGAAQAVGNLSRVFTKERALLAQRYLDDPDHAAAYLRYFLPVNLAKVQILLDEMPGETISSKPGNPIKVLDLGSGPGTGSLAVLDWLQHHKPEVLTNLSVLAVDSSSMALQQAGRLWGAYCRAAGIVNASFTRHEADLEKLLNGVSGGQIKQGGPYDLIILANCLNELFVEDADPIARRTVLVAEVLPLLTPQGTIMIVEPALRDTSRALHQVRDRLVQDNHCTIYSPCLHEKSCPALVNPFDWCHEERPWEIPPAIQEIDEQVGFVKDGLKFSYLLLRKDGRTIVERRPNVYRVVSELREMKGEKRAWLCNELGRQEVGRQDRLASPENAPFDQWHRGAIVQIDRIVRKEREGKVSALGRIEKDAAVRIMKSV